MEISFGNSGKNSFGRYSLIQCNLFDGQFRFQQQFLSFLEALPFVSTGLKFRQWPPCQKALIYAGLSWEFGLIPSNKRLFFCNSCLIKLKLYRAKCSALALR